MKSQIGILTERHAYNGTKNTTDPLGSSILVLLEPRAINFTTVRLQTL